MGQGHTVTHKLIDSHLLEGEMTPGAPGREIGIRIDQTLTQDATGTLVMLELEAMNLDRVKTELSAQYVDHNLVQTDSRNPDDHLFLHSACQRFGVWYSPAGNGVSHPVHQERFGKPGKTMAGSDSHTPAAGAIGMLAIGAGGLEVAMAMAGEPFYFKMPKVWGIELVGELPDWVSAKDVILALLGRHGVKGARGCILEYYGEGLDSLDAMDRHVLANMGTELGATSTVFPSDQEVRRFLKAQRREADWIELLPDDDAEYDLHERIDLSQIEPMIAMPSSPANVKPVREVAASGGGQSIYQSYVGSSANPGFRDFAIAAQIVKGQRVPAQLSFDVNPTSRQILENLVAEGHLLELIHAGARIHQAGCNGCIGMGQAPATDAISLRTVPRNFPGRSGTREDKVCLVSPETAAASALTGRITDPRELETLYGMRYPKVRDLEQPVLNTEMLVAPPPAEEARSIELVKGPNIASLPDFDPLPDEMDLEVALKVQDDISTDEIMPAGPRVLPYRSNIPQISAFCFEVVDETYPERAKRMMENGKTGHAIVGGENYGQGSSREHAALAPRYLGLRAVLARSFARIHWQNLANFGMLPLTFENADDYDRLAQGDELRLRNLREALQRGNVIEVENTTRGETIRARHDLSERQVRMILAGGLIPLQKQRLERKAA
ncbi:MAG: aconitate hydratase [Phycisphaeraceae bacterium]